MNPTDFSSPEKAPFSFGQHPKFERSYREFWQRPIRNRLEDIKRIEVPISRFADARHPEVFVVPRDRFIIFLEMEEGEFVGPMQRIFPFSSTDFCVDLEEEGLFREFNRSEAFFRLMGINQLGYLVPPRPKEWDKNQTICYTRPTFHHSRWEHSLLAAVLMEVVLARNGFSQQERAPVILTVGSHDIATPAGGDSVKRVDPEALDEEENFSWMLRHHGLDKRWAKQFNFNLSSAQKWVKGEGMFGRLLDVVDKIAYTALDCYHVASERPCQIRNFCIQHPLVMDVWQDIRFASDKTEFAFTDAERLFHFLLLRALEYEDFLFNPYSRTLDLYLKNLVQPLFERGVITKEQLLTWNDQQLESTLSEHYPQEFESILIEPEELSWKKFSTADEQKKFCSELGERVDHAEHITGFDSGLDWPVWERTWLPWKKKTITLRQAISQDEVELLEGVVASTQGYYVYYKRP